MIEDKLEKCPNCGSREIWRDSADVGVGVIFGPWGCSECCWSESEEYDMSKDQPAFYEDGGMLDHFGGYYPPGNLVAKACFRAYIEDCKKAGKPPVFRKKELDITVV